MYPYGYYSRKEEPCPTATALLLAEKKFRKVKGYRSMPLLLRALETEAPTQMVA